MNQQTCKIVLIALISLNGAVTYGQGFFNQKGAQIKNLKEQLLLLQLYSTEIKKGYGLAQGGLQVITDIKNGDFKMHGDHFAALSSVNPLVKKYAAAADMIRLQAAMTRLQPRQVDAYTRAVFARLVAINNASIDQLNALLTPGNYSLTDDQRIHAIDRLWLDMKDRYEFAYAFSADVRLLSLQQLKEKHTVTSERLLYQFK